MYRAPLVVRNLVKAVPRRAGHGHAAPSSENALPKWVQALEQAPRAQAIAGSIGAVIVTSGLIASIMMARGTHVHTLSDDWKNANKEFMKFQKMNPIFGISKGL